MAKPNYAFAKRQRDLAKKQKKEEKKLRKASGIARGRWRIPLASQGADPAEHGLRNRMQARARSRARIWRRTR